MYAICPKNYLTALLFTFTGILAACTGPDSESLFRQVPAAKSGIDFANTILENDTFNVLTYTYIYNGSGVGIGDFNNDGLPDLFFGGNQTSCKLYLNEGGLRFRDVTEKAGTGTTRWCTGVSLVDINDDGLLDAYVSSVNPDPRHGSPNYFFINQGVDENGLPVFKDKALEMGLADTGYSTQAAFFDYDKDGDLDMYLLTNGLDEPSRNTPRINRHEGRYLNTDRLYRNEGNGTFTNVSKQAGILSEGWGLGVAIADMNQDGWPDVYVANDFLTDDILYINNQDGTFSNRTRDFFRHLSYNGMGTDVADFNNDALPDVVVLDMMPEDNVRQKAMFPKANYDRISMNTHLGYNQQYVRNTLQLNNGDGTFSEIGQLAGVFATDWSWTPLFADFDNDGLRDLLITNGYHRDVTDLDYVTYSNNASIFGTDRSRLSTLYKAVRELKGVKKHNYFYRNRGDLTFEDVSAKWGFTTETYSNGAAFADLDLDGDLDLVVNNLNDKAMLMENRASERTENKALRVQLLGPPGNRFGQGAVVKVAFTDSAGIRHELFQEQNLYRGYKSTVESILHFGVGSCKKIDQISVQWPDGRYQVVSGLPTGTLHSLVYTDAGAPAQETVNPAYTPVLRDAIGETGLNFSTDANEYIDFKLQPLLMRKYSENGPGMAMGDVNGDQLPDLYIGGAAGKPAHLFLQKANGQFSKTVFPGPDSLHEDMGCLLFDADGDGDNDLYVASGGNERRAEIAFYRHRFYRNDGKGRFTRDTLAIPDIRTSGSVVTAADWEGDGDLDLFVGGRITPGRYPVVPRSYLLKNEGGKFTDVTPSLAPDLVEAGMVSAAIWTDVNGDGKPDLMVCGEYMPIRMFIQENGRFAEKTQASGLSGYSGWWNSLTEADLDLDGDPDYVAGNFGLNHRFQPAPGKEVSVLHKDFDGNGSHDAITSYFIHNDYYPAHPRDALIDQIIGMRVRYPRYDGYGKTPTATLLTPQEREGAAELTASWFATSVLINDGNGKFEVKALPVRAQFAPVFGVQVLDANGDTYPDILLSGNLFGSDPQIGPYDAMNGLLLKGDRKGAFLPVLRAQSGFYVPGDARSLVTFPLRSGLGLIAAEHKGPLRVFRAEQPGGFWFAAGSLDFALRLTFADGRSQRIALAYGSGYLSQSARGHWIPAGVKHAEVIGFNGQIRELNLPPL